MGTWNCLDEFKSERQLFLPLLSSACSLGNVEFFVLFFLFVCFFCVCFCSVAMTNFALVTCYVYCIASDSLSTGLTYIFLAFQINYMVPMELTLIMWLFG